MIGETAVVVILVAGAIWFFRPSGVSKAKSDFINSVSEEEIEAVITMGEADFVCAMVDRYGEPRGWVHVDDLENLAKDFRKKDQTYKVWRSLGNLDGGVNNGGFEGYFSNALGFQFLTAIDSARTVGDYDVAKVLDDLREELAAKGFAGDYSSRDYERLEESLEDILHSYSTRYCEAAKNLLARSELYLASKLCGVDLLARIPDSHESD